MPTYFPPKKNTQYIFYISLASQTSAVIMQSSPTIAAGDFKVSIDGGALANLGTLPVVTPAASKMVKVTLSTSEMNGDNITFVASDAAGAEWRDLVINIQTTAQQLDDLATQTSVNTIDDFIDTEIADIQARLPAALVSGRIDASVGAMASAVITATAIATDAIGAAELAADAVAEIADAVWDELTSGHTTVGSYGQADAPIRASTATAGAAGTITLDASASATDDLYNGCWIVITSSTGAGQARLISDYVGSTKVATVTPNWITNPSATSIFMIVPAAYIQGLVSLASGAIVAATFGAGAIDAAAIATDAIGSAEMAATATAEIAQAVWDALTSALVTSGSAGKLLVDNLNATVSSRASQTSVDTVDDFLDTEIAAIKAKTDNLPTDPADASDIAGSFTTVNTKLDTIDDFLDTEVAAIKAKTDNLPTDPADASDVAAAIAALNDVSVANILAGVIEGSLTLQDVLRLLLSAETGKASGGGTTTVVFRDNADSKDRITATVDTDGNRTAVTLDAS